MSDRSVVYKPPVEVVDGAAPAPLRQVGRSIGAATLVAFLLGSKPLLTWTNELPIGPVSDLLLYVAQDWDDAAGSVGLTRYGEAIRYWLRAFEGAR
jgi:hypothetical protein